MPNVNVERLALRKTSVTEVHWPRLPEPPPSIMKFPGMAEWWRQMQMVQERQQEMIYRMAMTQENT